MTDSLGCEFTDFMFKNYEPPTCRKAHGFIAHCMKAHNRKMEELPETQKKWKGSVKVEINLCVLVLAGCLRSPKFTEYESKQAPLMPADFSAKMIAVPMFEMNCKGKMIVQPLILIGKIAFSLLFFFAKRLDEVYKLKWKNVHFVPSSSRQFVFFFLVRFGPELKFGQKTVCSDFGKDFQDKTHGCICERRDGDWFNKCGGCRLVPVVPPHRHHVFGPTWARNRKCFVFRLDLEDLSRYFAMGSGQEAH